jgi:hypothetical protein
MNGGKLLVWLITIFFLLTTWILPVDYSTQTISSLGLFLDTPVLHIMFAGTVLVGGGIIILIWSIKNLLSIQIRGIYGIFNVVWIIIFFATLEPIFEWIAIWMMCIWVLAKLLKN